MDDADKASFEPFVTVSLGEMRQRYQAYTTTRIALSSNAPGVTAIHWYDAPAARRLVDELNKLIAVIDPLPPAAAPVPPKAKKRRLTPSPKPRKGKR